MQTTSLLLFDQRVEGKKRELTVEGGEKGEKCICKLSIDEDEKLN
jgi:hypothetical protein